MIALTSVRLKSKRDLHPHHRPLLRPHQHLLLRLEQHQDHVRPRILVLVRPDNPVPHGVEPVFLDQEQAIDYAKNRACFRFGEILDSTGKRVELIR